MKNRRGKQDSKSFRCMTDKGDVRGSILITSIREQVYYG